MRLRILTVVFALLAAVAVHAQSPESFIAAIERPQSGREGDLAPLPLAALMQKLGVPGFSIAVIRDFEIHWDRAAEVFAGEIQSRSHSRHGA